MPAALGAVGMMLLAFGLNPNLRAASALPMFWVKLLFPAALGLVPVNAIVAAPVFAGVLWAMKGLVPTGLVLAGAWRTAASFSFNSISTK